MYLGKTDISGVKTTSHTWPQGVMYLVALVVFIALAVLSFSGTAYSAGRHDSAWRYAKQYTLHMGVGLTYEKEWGDSGEGSSFLQQYSLQFSGYAVDPRLVSYKVSSNINYDMRKGNFGGDLWHSKSTLDVSFFNRINRNRGLKIWRYMPSPVTFGFGYTETQNLRITNFSSSLFYHLPGSVRFFGSGKFIYYDSGLKKAKKVNRFRVKFSDESLNYNRNGNGNWNRNGNGNWNRNGNGNWNRNGNGNWSSNGNGNDDGSWNRNSSLNGKNILKKQRSSIGFKFPSITMDFNHFNTEEKILGTSSSTSSGSVRARTGDTKKLKDGSVYRSNYGFYYNFKKSEAANSDSVVVRASNEWRRLSVSNELDKTKSTVQDNMNYKGRIVWSDHITRWLKYSLHGVGNFHDDKGVKTHDYSVGGSLDSALQKVVRLSPNLTSKTYFDAQFSRTQTRQSEGGSYAVNNYRLRGIEELDANHFRRLKLNARSTFGYSESGIPFTFNIVGRSRGFQKTTFMISYSFNTTFNSTEDSKYHELNIDYRYKAKYNLTFYSKFKYSTSITEEEFSSENYTIKSIMGGYDWKISSRSWVDGSGTMQMTDTVTKYILTTQYTRKLLRNSNLGINATIDWKSDDPGKHELYEIVYNWLYRSFAFKATYGYEKDVEGSLDHSIMLNAKRSFVKRVRGLF